MLDADLSTRCSDLQGGLAVLTVARLLFDAIPQEPDPVEAVRAIRAEIRSGVRESDTRQGCRFCEAVFLIDAYQP